MIAQVGKATPARKQRVTADGETLSTQDWIAAAKSVLLRDGIDAVKIDRIAKECGVTRGGFYWRFRNRAELLQTLLADWREKNSTPLIAALRGPGTPAERFEAAARLWLEEQQFDPRLDTAVRTWATNSAETARAVHEVDELRIAAFRDLFVDAGIEPVEALVRARIVYFHQVGYYTLALGESQAERESISRVYYRVLTSFPEFD
jgi:AcrR family transcriptional regulator